MTVTPSSARPRERRFRPEIEGLRAVAIGLVLIYHVQAPVLRGGFIGVDVFFVISGFLITSHILGEVESTGRLSLAAFWARRMKRLLPAAATVLVATALASWILLPQTSWRAVGGDVSAAALSLVNWRFASESIAYDAQGQGVSPVLHFWSLSVEEQFYVLWPVALGLAYWLFLRGGRPRRVRVIGAIVIGLIALPSLVWSVVHTPSDADVAFFVTSTRLWELGAGAAVAVGAGFWHRIPVAVSVVLGWGGVASIAWAAIAFDDTMPWPGSAALVPVLGTAAVIVASSARPRAFEAARLLGWRPVAWVGGLSYSWYLWHWPVLVLAEARFGELRLRYRILLVLGSGLLAWISLKWIENPVRRSRRLSERPGFMLSVGANLSLIGILAGLLLSAAVPARTDAAAVDPNAYGARALTLDPGGLVEPHEVQEHSAALVPGPAAALDDLPRAQRDGCVTGARSPELIVCTSGDPEGALDVAVVGDSKILQWDSAVARIAEERGWRITTAYKAGCPFAEPAWADTELAARSCTAWNAEALDLLLEERPDVVITSSLRVLDGSQDGDPARGVAMLGARWSELQDSGIRVVPILDNPSPGFEVADCVAQHPETLSACAFDRDAAIAASGVRWQLPAAAATGVDVVDMSDVACPPANACPAVIGDALLYRRGTHLTDSFVLSTIDILKARLVPAVEAGGSGAA
ncbi:acyltransferase [Leucobacter allii]|uniref:acyltransferase family protein n=1 Tax=Leucobacter allii TaxID=2932247 RepID=UPI001FD10503|nr:acyltransferase family protein [Leucobacter allii]UOR02246.1 acyltransferase [Leucobacter allii]